MKQVVDETCGGQVWPKAISWNTFSPASYNPALRTLQKGEFPMRFEPWLDGWNEGSSSRAPTLQTNTGVEMDISWHWFRDQSRYPVAGPHLSHTDTYAHHLRWEQSWDDSMWQALSTQLEHLINHGGNVPVKPQALRKGELPKHQSSTAEQTRKDKRSDLGLGRLVVWAGRWHNGDALLMMASLSSCLRMCWCLSSSWKY